MNIVLILASGVGNRFGDPVPKQYHLVRSRPAIEYVINAAITSCADEVVIVSSAKYAQDISDRYGVSVVEGGSERNISVQKGLDYIQDRYTCDKIIILDAVSPLVKPELINRYFRYLDEYDIVFTALKIPVSLGNYDSTPMDRSKFFMMASPEGYRFSQLYQYFDGNVLSDSIMHQLPADLDRKPCFEMRDFAKIIYPHDIAIIEAIMQEREKKRTFSIHLNEFTLTMLQRLREPFPMEIKRWEKYIDKDIEYLFYKWSIAEFSLVTTANSSIVFEAYSEVYGDVILKIIPSCFAKRYRSEQSMLDMLPSQISCKVIDKDDEKLALLLERVQPGDYVHLKNNREALKHIFSLISIFHSQNTADTASYDLFQPFMDFFALDVQKAKVMLKENSLEFMVLSYACTLYERHFLGLPQQLIHGDLCFKNLLKQGDHSVLIDPLGLVAPVEIEFANYFAYELFENYGNHKEIYQEIACEFADLISQAALDKALFVTLTIKLWATCLSGTNGSKQNANIWFQIISDLFVAQNWTFKASIAAD